MRAAIYGAGAMGTVLGAFIARAGVQIDLINRNQNMSRRCAKRARTSSAA